MAISYADDKFVRGDEMLELYREAGWSLLEARSAPRLEEAVKRSQRFFTARDGSRLAGFLMALTDEKLYAHVSELLVPAASRAKGVEAELLARFLASVEHVEVVTLFGEPDSVELYRDLGFVPFAGGFRLRRS